MLGSTRLRNILAVLFVLALLISGAFATTGTTAPSSTLTNRNLNLPAVPVGGIPLNIIQTEFHPTGLLAVPRLENWNLPGGGTDDGKEKLIVTDGPNGFGRMGIMLINSQAGSVVHTFIEHDPVKIFANVQALDASYTGNVLAGAWTSYTGGWRELDRRIDGDQSVINFELIVKGDRTGVENLDYYRARQVSQMRDEWLVSLRLVVPENNPGLLDQLQAAMWPKIWLNSAGLVAPISWNAISDNVERYTVRYPSQWTITEGVPGRQYTVTGALGADVATLITRTAPDAPLATEADVRAWIATNAANNPIKRVVQENTDTWSVSLDSPDVDGNSRSAVTTIRRMDGKLFIITVRLSARGVDLLDPAVASAYPELPVIRNSLTTIPADMVISPVNFATSVPATAAPTTVPQ